MYILTTMRNVMITNDMKYMIPIVLLPQSPLPFIGFEFSAFGLQYGSLSSIIGSRKVFQFSEVEAEIIKIKFSVGIF